MSKLANKIAQRTLVNAPTGAAVGQLSVDNYRWDATNSVLPGSFSHFGLAHVQDFNLTGRANNPVNHVDRLFARGTTCAEDLYFTLTAHYYFSLKQEV
jgi:hypothetical protein